MVLSLFLLIEKIFAHPRFHPVFDTPTTSKLMPSWDSLEALDRLQRSTQAYIMDSGSISFLDVFPGETITRCKGFLYAVTLES